MAHASTSIEPFSLGEAERLGSQLDQGGSAPPDEALDDEDGNSQPLLQSKPEAEGRGHIDDREAGIGEEGKNAHPQPERGLSRLQSINLL